MRPKPRLFPLQPVCLQQRYWLRTFWAQQTFGGAEVASALPSLSGTQLTGPFPATATVTTADLNKAGRTLVDVDDGLESVSCLGSGTSWARVADFTPPAFPATGNTLVQKDMTTGNRADGSSSRAFVTVDGLAKEIRRRVGDSQLNA
jgi:hypothetical protein